jgi:hypothetical protein
MIYGDFAHSPKGQTRSAAPCCERATGRLLETIATEFTVNVNVTCDLAKGPGVTVKAMWRTLERLNIFLA